MNDEMMDSRDDRDPWQQVTAAERAEYEAWSESLSAKSALEEYSDICTESICRFWRDASGPQVFYDWSWIMAYLHGACMYTQDAELFSDLDCLRDVAFFHLMGGDEACISR